MFEFDPIWHELPQGSPEEQVGFAALLIRLGDANLTENVDGFTDRLEQRANLSAYHLAEWLAWNWWRLRWEPYSNTDGWDETHCMVSVGHGYVWPNITFVSDGQRIEINAKPTRPTPNDTARYLANYHTFIAADDLERAIDKFLASVLAHLDARAFADTNLHQVWEDVKAERGDPDVSRWRRFEALLGYDPDEADIGLLERMVEEVEHFGDTAMDELAAARASANRVMSRADIEDLANRYGYDARSGDQAGLANADQLSSYGSVPAWQRGAEAAALLRAELGLDGSAIRNEQLADICGVASDVIEGDVSPAGVGFALGDDDGARRIVLRRPRRDGRRFELARLLGDAIAVPQAGRLNPDTDAGTYRQQMQRSFATEFLCPYEALIEMLGDEMEDPDAWDQAALHFGISAYAIPRLLANKGAIDHALVP